jgi:hypothetical protein
MAIFMCIFIRDYVRNLEVKANGESEIMHERNVWRSLRYEYFIGPSKITEDHSGRPDFALHTTTIRMCKLHYPEVNSLLKR